MADKILHKRSLTANSIPTTASLNVGEIAINVNDGKLFVRRSGSLGDTIVPIVTTGITNSGSIIGNFTGSLFGTASYATNAQTASYYNTSNLLTTASVSNATITFIKGDASTFPITINNVVNAQTASYVLSAVSSSYASYANNANVLDGYNSTDFAILNANNTFTADQLLVQSALTLSSGYVLGTVLDKPSLVLGAVNSRYFHYVYTRHKNASAVDNAIDFYTSDGTPLGAFPANAVHGMTITNGKVGIKTTSPNYELDVNGNANITGSVTITGSVITNTGFTGSLFGTASFADVAQLSLTASYIQTAVTATYALNSDLFDGRDSTTFAGTGSNTFTGVQTFNTSITGTHAYFSGDVIINGTASIGMLETRNQQSLVVGDKYIVIMSGAIDHTTLDGSGILFGSGSTGPTTDENGANAYLRYRNAYDAVEAFPGFRVSGSLSVTNGSTFTTVSGTIARFTELTASSISGTITNALTASYILNAVSSSYASNADLLDGRDSTSFAGLTGNTFNGNQIITGTLNVSSIVSGTIAQFSNITSSTNIIGTALYTSKITTTVVGNNVIYNVATASYDGIFVDYTARSGSNARAGQIMAIWSGSFVNYTETTTNDFGLTTGLGMAVVINGTNMQLSASASTANWTVKTIIRTI